MIDNNRKSLLVIYQQVLDAVNGQKCVHDYLAHASIGSNQYIIAIGKAAPAMMQGALSNLAKGIVITRHGYGENLFATNDRICMIESGHPAPDESSLVAGKRLLEFIRDIPHGANCLFLLSGGASALVEVLPEGIDIDDLIKVNNWLLGSGLAINEMNVVRKSLSCIKGGRLAKHFNGINLHQLVMSDVIGDQLDIIGSGLLVPSNHTPLSSKIPDWIQNLINKAPPTPDKGFPVPDTAILANNLTAMQEAKEKALSLGMTVFLHPEPLIDEVQQVADRLSCYINTAQQGLHVFGGEPVINLPAHAGRGGRMQALALLLAQAIARRDDVLVLCGSTDGSDGSGEDAGALVDGTTLERGEMGGFDIDDCIRRADAGSFLEAAGDLIQTGPTGSNVNDLVLVLIK